MENYFFDFDGTICESRHIYAASVQKAFEARGVKVPTTEDIYQAMGNSDRCLNRPLGPGGTPKRPGPDPVCGKHGGICPAGG